ncbi:Myotrophin [Colletotrichum siamense]|nr:Myotrophin [Colletotrichum siamense]
MEAPVNVPSNLWDIARKRLTHDEEAQLAKAVVDNNTLSQQLLELVYAKQQQCMDRRLKFKRSNGDVIVLKDVFEKVVKWLQKFKEVGDVATQYDPVHAALPWAGVRMLLQIAINDTETLGAIAEGIETVSHLIARCAIYEGLYLNPRSFPLRQPHTMLRDALVSLYAVILEWLSKAGVYYAKPVGRRCLAAITSPAPTLTSIAQKEQAVLQLASAIQDQMVSTMAGVLETMDANFISLLAILKDLEQPIVRIIGTLDLIANNMKAEEQARLAIWLSRIRHEYVHKQVHRLVPDTGQWLLGKKEYIEWRDSSCSSTLWLHGVPGCGKSKLSSLVVQQHRDRVSCNANAAPVAFCYCSRSGIDGSPPTPPIIMGSILKQLAFFGPERGVYHSVRDEFCRRVNDAQGLEPIPLSLDDCQELIILITADYPVTIIIDGLDEAQGEIRDLLDTLQRIMEESQNIVKLFVSSRAETLVDIHLQQSFKSIQVTSADIAQDISTFVKDKVYAAVRHKRLLRGRQVRQELESRVIETLISGSDGMFLWASLNLEQLCGPEFELEADLDKELETLRAPTSIMNILEEMYQRVLKYRPMAKAITNTVFGCLLISERRISQSELLDMISVSTYSEAHDDFMRENTLNLEDVRNLCRGFVDFTDPSSFSFAHDTIREYIAGREEFQPSDLHHVAMSRCLKYLTRQYRDLRLFSPGNPSRSAGTAIPDNIRLFARDADNDEQDTVPVSFWFYAVCYWPRHYSMIECVERRSKAEAEVLQFVFSDQGYRHNMWLEDVLKLIYQPSRASKPSAVTHLWWELNDCQSPSHSPIFVASVYGITGVTRQLAKKSDEINWNMKNKDGVSAVTLSASWGRDDILEFLLMRGASVNTTEGHYGTPIQAASFHGNTRAVQVLIENGADPLAKGFFDTALHAAFSGGDEPTIQLLVDNDTCHKSTNLGTLIRAASYSGYHGALKSLLRRYFDGPVS